ncbi:MAG TPA: energy-coupling factor transporter transmembrane component T [Syntrophomonadaceae bacterium]|nr:energy-coupling factor transporter transmembrane component T [Syntrophomonadaceae bacterium]
MINLGQYLYRESSVHKRDPRVKIIAVTAFSIVILQAHIPGLLGATAMIVAASQLARIAPGALLKTLRPVFPFFLGLFLVYILFTPGTPLPPFPIGPVQISYQGLQLGVLQIWKFVLLVMAASILTMTTTPSEITGGLERLLRPLTIVGISSHDVAMMVSLALRFVPTLQEEMTSIREAQLARGLNLNTRSVGSKIRAITTLATPLSSSVFRRCDELVEAMEARGYQPGYRTYLREMVLTPGDYFMISIMVLLALAMLAWPS